MNSRKGIAIAVGFTASVLILNAQEVFPGTLNFSEGQVALNGQGIANDAPGTVSLTQGQTLETGQGRAEVLLTPGVYVRVGENSQLKMDALSANSTKLELVKGEAIVEVDQVAKTQRLDFVDQGRDAHLDRSGLFLFNANQGAVSVYSGSVRVEDDRRGVEVKKGERLVFTAGGKPEKFDLSESGNLYAWSQKRADLASQVSEWTGEAMQVLNDTSSYKAGWYWNPFYKSWAFIPQKGYVLTPFHYGLYAPDTPHSITPVFGDFR